MIIKRNSQMSSLRTKIRWSQISWRKDQRVDRVGWLRIPRKVDCRIIITLELLCTLMASLHISETDKGTITLTLVLPVLTQASKVLMVMSHRHNFWAAVRDRLPACRSLAGRWGHQLLYLCQLLYHRWYHCPSAPISMQFFSGQALTGSTTNCTSQLLFHLSFPADTQVTPALIVFIWPASLVNALTNEVLSRSLFFPSFVSF